MQVKNITFAPNINLNRKNNNVRNIYLNTLKADSVSFGSYKKSNFNYQMTENMESAVRLGKKLMDLPRNTYFDKYLLEEIIHGQTPDITVLPITRLASEIPDYMNYGAFFTAKNSEQFSKPLDCKIYINYNKANRGEPYRLNVIRDTVHEYTHALQISQGERSDYLSEKSNNDYNYANLILALGETLFKPFDNDIQAYSVLGTFRNFEDMKSVQMYGFVTPRKQKVSRKDILKSLNLQNEQEFKAMIKSQFNALFTQCLNDISQTPQLLSMLPQDFDYNELSDVIKKYCSLIAKQEKEAYSAENIIAKRYLNTDESINLDIFPIYYEMLQEALSE